MTKTRQTWIDDAIAEARPIFKAAGHPLPRKLRASCSWPVSGALRKKNGSRTIGQCFYPEASAAGYTEIALSWAVDKPVEVLAIIWHELVHAALDADAGHGPRFKALATALGLTGKMTATEAGPELTKTLKAIAKRLGKYKHDAVDVAKIHKPQTTRMVKAECGTCGYTVRTSMKWIEIAIPTCPDEDCSNNGFEMEIG